MDSSSTATIEDYLDDSAKLEDKVVYAMMRLQDRSKSKSRSDSGSRSGERKPRPKQREIDGVEIVEYMCDNYKYLDGDVESQVITALLSCVKNGVVCAQINGKYRLVGPSPKMMVSSCVTRTSHGSKCSCQNVISKLSKMNPENCCTLKVAKDKKSGKKRVRGPVFQREPAALAKQTRSVASKTRAKTRVKGKTTSQKLAEKREKVKYLQRVMSECSDQNLIDVENSDENKMSRCEYCLEYHTKVRNARHCKGCPQACFNSFPIAHVFDT